MPSPADAPQGSSSQDVLAAAVRWQVRLTSGNTLAAEREAFAQWLRASTVHAAAWHQVQGLMRVPVQQIQQLAQRQPPGQQASQLQAIAHSLAQSPSAVSSAGRRKLLGGSVAVLLAGSAAALLAHRSQPLDGLLADLSTGTGEARHVTLPDGSSLDLNARSAVDLRYSASERRVRLLTGEVLVQVVAEMAAESREGGAVGPMGTARRPFSIQTRHGTAQALGTRYLVRQEETRSLLVVLQHSVALRTAGGQERVLQQGQAAWWDADHIQPINQPMAHHTGWAEGVLDVRNESLGEVMEALRPWRKGLIRISPQAARLRVFGVFRLNDTQQVLQALVDTQPIRVTTYGPLLTLVDLK